MPEKGETSKAEETTSVDPQASKKPAVLNISGRAALALSLCLALLLGAGGYLFGKSTGPGLERAKQLGARVGSAEGAEQGASKGFSASFPKARQNSFDKAYARSYRRNFAGAYVDAGLAEPEAKSIEVSR